MRFALVLSIAFFTTSLLGQQNVGIGTTTPDSSAKLDIQSTSQGALIPRMTTAERDAIGNPATGLMIYNLTDSCVNFYNGDAWLKDDDRSATNELQDWNTLPGIPAGFQDGVDDVTDNLGNHSAIQTLSLNNHSIVGADLLAFNDAGLQEGISWTGTQARIYVSQLNGQYSDTDGYLRLLNDDGISLEDDVRITGSTNMYGFLHLNGYNISGVANLSVNGVTSLYSGLYLNGNSAYGLNALSFSDPGTDEGISWGGSAAKIYVAPLNGGNGDGALHIINDDFITFQTSSGTSKAMYLWPDKHAQFNGWIDVQGGTAGLSPTDAGTQMHQQLRLTHPANNAYSWWIGHQGAAPSSTDDDLYFYVLRGTTAGDADNIAGYIQDNVSPGPQMNFTGQHRTLVEAVNFQDPDFDMGSLEGRIVVADQNRYMSMSGGLQMGLDAVLVDEALPVVSLCEKRQDKRVFGVISSLEPDDRHEAYGAFTTPYPKEEGDERIYINAVGEGAIWVVEEGGSLESGDYIQSSSVPGYGMLQSDDLLHNYTVAKITMDCDFEPALVAKQKILKVEETVNGEVTTSNAVDALGRIIWVPETDAEGQPVMEYLYKMRYLTADGREISKADYEMLKASCTPVFRAAFVGCTYHCG